MNARTVQVEFSETETTLPVAMALSPSTRGPSSGVIEVEFQTKLGEAKRPTRNDQVLEALARSELLQEFQKAFSDATGLPLTLRAVDGWQLAHAGHRRQNGFCALMSEANRSCASCLQMQQRICDGVNGVPCTLTCPFGLNESAVGVKVGQDLIAYLQTGQVFFKPPTAQLTNRALKQLQEWKLELDREEASRRFKQTRVVARNEYLATVRLLQFFADQLGALANQIVLQQKTAEPVQITRARQFIEDHYQEDLSLAEVAKQAGMSPFYFCKVFKKVTGTNFTQYVSRVRIERAKNLLLNRNYRVSEIAFEVGFQSLTHFNRIFRSIAGKSPTKYREHLPAT